MSVSSCPGSDLLLLLEHDLLDDPSEDERLRDHRANCAACGGSADFLSKGLAPPSLPFDPSAELEPLRERLTLHASSAQGPDPEVLGVRLLCTYCKDALPKAETVYCAQCVAPHHGECFAEHGLCAAPGCGALDVVRTTEAPARRRAPRWRTGSGLLAAVLIGGGVAALWPSAKVEPVRVSAPQDERSPAAVTSDVVEVRYGVVDILGVQQPSSQLPVWRAEWEHAYEQVLDSRVVTLNFAETPLREGIGFLQDITGLNLTVDPAVDLDATLSLRLREIPLRDALLIICQQAQIEYRYQNETLRFAPHGRSRKAEPANWPLQARSADATRSTPGDELLADLEAHLQARVGASLGVYQLALEPSEIVVRAAPNVQAVAKTFLDARRPPAIAAGLEDAWFAPDWVVFEEPAAARARQYALGLQERTVDLWFDDHPFSTVVVFFTTLGERVRLDAEAAKLLQAEQAKISLRAKGVSLMSALNLVVAAHPKLVWDVDRQGVLIRLATSPSLRGQLDTAARFEIERREGSNAEILKRLRKQTLSVDFMETPFHDVVDFLRELTGLNYVVAAGVDAGSVTLKRWKAPAFDVVEAILKPAGLGMHITNGVVKIVPRRLATERSELREQATATRPFGEALRGAHLGAFVGRLETITGAHVKLTGDALACRGRLSIPPDATVEDALELARQQLGLRWSWGWTRPGEEPVLALDLPLPGPLVKALQKAAAGAPWRSKRSRLRPWADMPAPLRAAYAARRATLVAALEELNATPNETEALRHSLRGVDTAFTGLEELRDANRTFSSTPESWRGGAKQTADAYEQLQEKAEEYYALGVAERLRAARFEREHGEIASQMTELYKVAPRWWKDREGPEPSAEQKAESWRLSEALTKAQDTEAAAYRKAALGLARCESQRQNTRGRVLELGWLPSWNRRVEAKAELLEGGMPWERVFPGGYGGWIEAGGKRDQHILRVGLELIPRLGFTLRRGEPGVLLGIVHGSAEAAGLRAGDRVLTVGEQHVEEPLDVLEQLAAVPAGETVVLVVSRSTTTVTCELVIPKVGRVGGVAKRPAQPRPGGNVGGEAPRKPSVEGD